MRHTIIAAATEHEAAAPACELATALARPLGAEVILAAVVERHGHVGAEGDPRLNRLLDRLDALAEGLPHDVPVTVDGVACPSVAGGLHDLATKHGAQLLVLGPSDRGAVARALFGDSAADAVFTAPCGVAFATPGTAHDLPRRIAVGWDRSPEADEALEWAVQLAERTGGSVEIVHVAGQSPGGQDPSGWVAEAELERLRKAVEQRAPATCRIAWGNPAELLTHRAREADLLVLGARRRGPVRRAVLGSVSQDVLRHAPGPVVVLPRGVHAPADTAAV